jgi:ankyrin repeat protein
MCDTCTFCAEIVRLVDAGEDINEVEGAGNTPLHNAAWAGWLEGVELLLGLGAKVDASNNAGDRPWHWATNMGHAEVAELLIKVCGACVKDSGSLKRHRNARV